LLRIRIIAPIFGAAKDSGEFSDPLWLKSSLGQAEHYQIDGLYFQCQ
jgi:hypothetical protein